MDDNPVVAPDHAVAISMAAGPRAGLELVQRLGTDPRVNADRLFDAVRGHLLVRAGHPAAALEAYRAAARVARTSSSSATSIDRSLACRAGRPPDSGFEDHTGLEGESGFGLDRIRMALRSFSVNRDNRPLL